MPDTRRFLVLLLLIFPLSAATGRPASPPSTLTLILIVLGVQSILNQLAPKASDGKPLKPIRPFDLRMGFRSREEIEAWQRRAEAARRFIIHERGLEAGRPEPGIAAPEGGRVYFSIESLPTLTFSFLAGTEDFATYIAKIELSPHHVFLEEGNFLFAYNERDLFQQIAVDERGIIYLIVSPDAAREILVRIPEGLLQTMPVRFISRDDSSLLALHSMRLDQTVTFEILSTGTPRSVEVLASQPLRLCEAFMVAGLFENAYTAEADQQGTMLARDEFLTPGSKIKLRVRPVTLLPPWGEDPHSWEVERPITFKELLAGGNPGVSPGLNKILYEASAPWVYDDDVEILDEEGKVLAKPSDSSEGAVIRPAQTIHSIRKSTYR